jgi:hypothetical protein
MRNKVLILIAAVALAAIGIYQLAGREHVSAAAIPPQPVPILVELFTSEGCSSCPPADALLQKFDAQPIAGAQLIVLSEHVDYWNHIGWTDPYSAHAYSERQSAYSHRFGLASVYTPQMIVDGTDEFVGASSGDAERAFSRARKINKTSVQLSDLRLKDGVLHGRVAVTPGPANTHKTDVIVAVALKRAESQVARGENAGRHLTHVAVVRTLQRLGVAEVGKPFSEELAIPVDRNLDAKNIRVIAFLQEPGPGRVWGATELSLLP